jgi:hypothetical protein
LPRQTMRRAREDAATATVTDAVALAPAERGAQPLRGRRPVTG